MKDKNSPPLPSFHKIKKDELTDNYFLESKHEIRIPDKDVNDRSIPVRSSDLKKVRKNLLKIKDQTKKHTTLITGICGTILGISLPSLFSLLQDNIPTSPLKVLINTLITMSSLFVWIWFERRPNINISERIDEVLEELPDPEKTISLGETSGY